MKLNDVFDRICLIKPIPDAVFSIHLESILQDLTVRYGEKYTVAHTGDVPLRDEYENALYMGILYCITAEPEHGEQYRRLANGAYYRVWREMEAKRRKEASSDV